MRLSHNMSSMRIYNNYKKALADQKIALTNLSTGTKVNNSKDDAYAISKHDVFTMQLSGSKVASQNAQDGISLLQTADGALSNMTSSLQRIRELTVQASNDTNTDSDKVDIQLEVTNLVNGITNMAKGTNMNNVSLLNSSSTSLNTMVGANIGENVTIPAYNLEASNLTDTSGNSLDKIDVTTVAGATSALNVVDAAMATIGSVQSKYGALENGLQGSITSMSELGSNTETADSSVMDTDMASEMTRYTTDNILVQAGIAMMAQTNKFPSDVLNILQNVK